MMALLEFLALWRSGSKLDRMDQRQAEMNEIYHRSFGADLPPPAEAVERVEPWLDLDAPKTTASERIAPIPVQPAEWRMAAPSRAWWRRAATWLAS